MAKTVVTKRQGLRKELPVGSLSRLLGSADKNRIRLAVRFPIGVRCTRFGSSRR